MMKLNEKEALDSLKKEIKDFLFEDKESLFQIVDERLWDNELEEDEYYDEKVTDIVDELYSEIEEERETNPTEFEQLFQEACDNALSDDNEDVYVEFCKLLKYDTPINTWHIEQNELKNYTNGKETIRDLCYSKYCEHREWEKEVEIK